MKQPVVNMKRTSRPQSARMFEFITFELCTYCVEARHQIMSAKFIYVPSSTGCLQKGKFGKNRSFCNQTYQMQIDSNLRQ